ncbi:MAG: glycosyl hydrolase 53 family protein [Saprospiraceae bacterium]|nr:glycosyl hydrolase 53 family protein [Saprospiraceae bacterium]
MKIIRIIIYCFLILGSACGQTFYFGNDLTYINEIEDCGVVYKEQKLPKDPYRIFADHGGNLVRLRLWKDPSWYKNLNSGKMYSDFEDVARSIKRAHQNNMEVLLDFHLSDNWADPSKQLVMEIRIPLALQIPWRCWGSGITLQMSKDLLPIFRWITGCLFYMT